MVIQQPVADDRTVTSRSSAWQKIDKERGFPDSLLDLIAARFRLLGEPLRLKLLAALASGERNVGELVALTGAGQPNVSKHLSALTQSGLVRRRKAGTSIYYAVADPTVLTLCDVVCGGIQQRFAAQARALGWPSEPAFQDEAQTAKEDREDREVTTEE